MKYWIQKNRWKRIKKNNYIFYKKRLSILQLNNYKNKHMFEVSFRSKITCYVQTPLFAVEYEKNNVAVIHHWKCQTCQIMVKSNLFHHLSTTRQVLSNFLEGNIACSSSSVPIRAWKSWLWKTLMTLSIECLSWVSPVWLSLVRYSSRSSSALWASEKHI